MKGIKNILRK